MLSEDALDRVSSDLVTEVAERAADPRVTPVRVLGGELDDQEPQPLREAGIRTAKIEPLPRRG